MKYYCVRKSSDPKVIGVKNGVYQLELNETSFKSENEYSKFVLSFSDKDFEETVWPNIKDNLLEVSLLKKAKVTDFMGFCPNLMNVRFAITSGCLFFLKNYSLKKFNLLRTKVLNYNDSDQAFYLFWYPFTESDIINFKESVLFTGNELLGKKYHTINDLVEFEEFMKKSPLFSFEKIVLNKTEMEYDLIWLRVGGMFISERLKVGIIKEGLTGLNIVEKHAPILEFS